MMKLLRHPRLIPLAALLLSAAVAAGQEESPSIQRLRGGIVKSFPHTWRVKTVISFSPGYDPSACETWNMMMVVPIPSSDEVMEVRSLDPGGGTVKSFEGSGSRYAAYSIDRRPPEKITLSYEVTIPEYRVDLSGLADLPPYDATSEVYRAWTGKTSGQIDPAHPKILEHSKRLKAESKNLLDYLRRAYAFTYDHMPYKVINYDSIDDMYRQGSGGRPVGDCGAHSIFFCSLLRAGGIPARLKTGWVVDGPTLGSHMWAEYWVEGSGWVPCDPTYGGSYLDRNGAEWLPFNRGERLEASIGDWKPVFENGMQTPAWGWWYSGAEPGGKLSFTTRYEVTALSDPDEAAYYMEGARVEALKARLTALVGERALRAGKAAPILSPELSAAALACLSESAPGWERAVADAGFSWKSAIWLQHRKRSLPHGADVAGEFIAWLDEDGATLKYLSEQMLGIGYRYGEGVHELYFISSSGRPSGKVEVSLPKSFFQASEKIPVTLRITGTTPDALDWIGLYEAGETPDGDPPSIWWARLGDLGVPSGGTLSFDPASIPADRKGRWKPGASYKFIVAWWDGYQVVGQAGFSLTR